MPKSPFKKKTNVAEFGSLIKGTGGGVLVSHDNKLYGLVANQKKALPPGTPIKFSKKRKYFMYLGADGKYKPLYTAVTAPGPVNKAYTTAPSNTLSPVDYNTKYAGLAVVTSFETKIKDGSLEPLSQLELQKIADDIAGLKPDGGFKSSFCKTFEK